MKNDPLLMKDLIFVNISSLQTDKLIPRKGLRWLSSISMELCIQNFTCLFPIILTLIQVSLLQTLLDYWTKQLSFCSITLPSLIYSLHYVKLSFVIHILIIFLLSPKVNMKTISFDQHIPQYLHELLVWSGHLVNICGLVFAISRAVFKC